MHGPAPLQLSKVHPQGSHDVWPPIRLKLREIIRHQVW